MDKEYIRSDDRNVAIRKVYAKASDPYGYVDSACKTKIGTEELHNAFLKGMMIVAADGTEYLPVSCKMMADVVTVTYVKPNGSTATSADLATIKSA